VIKYKIFAREHERIYIYICKLELLINICITKEQQFFIDHFTPLFTEQTVALLSSFGKQNDFNLKIHDPTDHQLIILLINYHCNYRTKAIENHQLK
jgi:hypothetical protein